MRRTSRRRPTWRRSPAVGPEWPGWPPGCRPDSLDGRLALAVGRRAAGLAHVRRGLDDLSKFQATFGSQDLQAAASVHGRELARLGLRTAVESGSPAAILQWLERARGVTTRLPAVRPPADPDFARQLGEFRAGYQQARQAVLSGERDEALEMRIRERRRRVQAMAWSTAGQGDVRRPLSLTAVQRRLATADNHATVVAYIRGDGRPARPGHHRPPRRFPALGSVRRDPGRHPTGFRRPRSAGQPPHPGSGTRRGEALPRRGTEQHLG